MTDEIAVLDLTQACSYLELSPDNFAALKAQGLIASTEHDGQPNFPKNALALTKRLLALGHTHGWGPMTLGWYADLVFASQVGRTILLPIAGKKETSLLAESWLETPYVTAVLEDLDKVLTEPDGPLVPLLQSLTALAVGEGRFWADQESLALSALFPLIAYFEAQGVPILDQSASIGRDASLIFALMMIAFTSIASPISQDLAHLLGMAQVKLGENAVFEGEVPPQERALITNETLVAVDKLYAAKKPEIHTPPDTWDFKLGVMSAQRHTITFQLKVPLDSTEEIIDNIIDLIRPYVGPVGARVVHLLYEIANDEPYWRNPLITVDTNELLDRLGLRRDGRGVHYSRNRERLRNILNIAHSLEIVGEYTTWDRGKPVRKALRRTVLSLIGATFDPEESHDLSTNELFQRGLPKTMQIRLNFYDGVRRPDGRLGNQYVLLPRLGEPEQLPSARHATTEELLKAYLLFRYRQTRMENRTLVVTRQIALEKANITNKNPRQATITLRKALDRLVTEGTIERYGQVPLRNHLSFEVILSEKAIATKNEKPNV